METSKSGKILNLSRLEELQESNDLEKLTLFSSFKKFYNDDMFTTFEKEVLKLKPNDCPIIQKFSKVETYPIQGVDNLDQISLSVIQSEHPLREFHRRSIKNRTCTDTSLDKIDQQLEKIDMLPVLVFIHGMGGQMSQFEPVLQELRNCCDLFGLDLPGFGNSKRPSLNNKYNASKGIHYTSLFQMGDDEKEKIETSLNSMTDAAFETDTLAEILYQILQSKFPKRKFIFIAHSMGTHLTIKLINKLEYNRVESFIMLAPPNIADNKDQSQMFSRLPISRRLFLHSCWYLPKLFNYFRLFDRVGGLHSHSVESFIYHDLSDSKDDDILKRLTQFRWNLDTDSEIFLKYLNGFKLATKEELIECSKRLNTHQLLLVCGENDKVTPVKFSENIYNTLKENGEIKIKFDKVPNCNHSLFLDKPNLMAGIVYKFIEELNLNISCTWVLQVKALISGDKWSMKNEVKWNNVMTVSRHLENPSNSKKSYLLGMKTLRQNDQSHNPLKFEEEHPEVFAIVDIGSDTPSYDPSDFKRIKYLKYKTESKVTPDNITIVKFIEIVDKLMKERETDEQFVVVHCHYGQNRTGFLICCYLIEKLGWTVTESIQSFEQSKPPGIKHVHFKNALYLRYGEIV